MRDLQPVLDAVRDAPNAEELDEPSAQRTRFSARLFGTRHRGRNCPATGIASFDMAMRELRSRIAARRVALAG